MLLGMIILNGCAGPLGHQAVPDSEIAAHLGTSAPLLPLFAALWRRESGESNIIPILQIGDSHTASDVFSGRLRELFQARFGDAGRGLLPPGIPHRYYRPARVEVAMQGWTTIPSADIHASGPFGLAGLRQHTDGPAIMTLSGTAAGEPGTVEVEFLRQPGGGTISLEQDNVPPISISTDGQLGAARAVAPSVAGTTAVRVRAIGDGPVDVLGWTVMRGTPGVTYSNLGTIGASVTLLDRWDATIVRAELARLSPALIVFAFGTNEGFRDTTDPESYGARFAERLRLTQAAAPGAAVLVVGPPDGARHRRKGDVESGDCGDPNWGTPPRLASVRAKQRAAAQREGAFFWDWQAAMGGACSMLRWASFSPPLAAPDHVHLLASGYRQSAESLFGTIMEGYERYRTLRGAPARPIS